MVLRAVFATFALCLFSHAANGDGGSGDPAEDAPVDIYQELWELDLRHDGCTTAAAGGDADVVIAERAMAGAGPLFVTADEDKVSRPTYAALTALFDNYKYKSNQAEDFLGGNDEEDAERRAFLSAVVGTEVGRRAREYVNSALGYSFDEYAFRTELERIWFEPYTNYFDGRRTPHVTGFEHVFVGESQADPNNGKVGGYHSWSKFLLDEKSGAAEYRKSVYGGAPGLEFPEVATIEFGWDPDGAGGMPEQFKPTGGFFVGPSPELQLMLGTVAFFESVGGQFGPDDKKQVTLNGAAYDLVLYREAVEGSSQGRPIRGDQIRSFFPIFVGRASDDGSDGGGGGGPGGGPARGAVQVTRALVNSPGDDPPGSEWVEVRNTTAEALDLEGWRLRDSKGRAQRLSGILLPGEAREITVTRDGDRSLQLTNGGGSIAVVDPAGEVVDVVGYGKSDDGEVLTF